MAEASAHAWMLPRLRDLLAEAEKAGIARTVAVAVLIDLIDSQEFDRAKPAPDAGEGAGSPNG